MSNNPFNNGVFNTVAPTLSNGQLSAVQLDVNGNLKVATLPAGTNVIGHVLVDSVSGSVAVTGTFFQATQPVSLVSLPALSAGSAVIGHVIVDTAPSTVVTQGVGMNLHVVVDSAPTTAVTGTFFQATQPVSLTSLPALAVGTNLIGSVSASTETSTVYNGTTPLTPQFANITASASGVTTIIALVAAKKIRVLAIWLTANAAVNVKWQSHVTPTDITGLAYLAANGGYVLPFNPAGWFQTVAGEALDINLSGATPVGGSITYVAV